MDGPPLPPPPDLLPPGPAPGYLAAPPPYQPAPKYASFWRRFAALLIDGLVFLPVWFIAFFTLAWPNIKPQLDRMAQNNEPFDATWWAGRFFGVALLLALLQYAYQAIMIAYWGGTLGKLAVGIRVKRDDGSAAGWHEALTRPALQLALTFMSFVPGAGLASLLDYLWMLWDKQKQCLHDKIASTIVVVVA